MEEIQPFIGSPAIPPCFPPQYVVDLFQEGCMKQNTFRKPLAMTLIEVLVVIAILLLLASLVLPYFSRCKAKSMRISCLMDLKEIGAAYRLWANDNGDVPPFQQTVKNGGWADFLTNANQGAICWTNYVILQNQLRQSPALVACPCDTRKAALSFTNKFDNAHVSYFVGVCATDLYPQSIVGGDRNLGFGTNSGLDYGFSPKTGKGNDQIIPISAPLSWSLTMHSGGNPAGAGNIFLGDGSGQQVTSSTLMGTWMPNAQGTSNWPAGHIPAVPSIRLVFP
jgi:type II secretory pathway pseudopilin PulG